MKKQWKAHVANKLPLNKSYLLSNCLIFHNRNFLTHFFATGSSPSDSRICITIRSACCLEAVSARSGRQADGSELATVCGDRKPTMKKPAYRTGREQTRHNGCRGGHNRRSVGRVRTMTNEHGRRAYREHRPAHFVTETKQELNPGERIIELHRRRRMHLDDVISLTPGEADGSATSRRNAATQASRSRCHTYCPPTCESCGLE